jgi:hypothetical protein
MILSGNDNITDAGVVALADALLQTTQTLLTDIDLSDVGMGDEGIAALALLVQQDRMRRLECLQFCGNDDISNRGIICFAGSINMKGLPVLTSLFMSRLGRLTAVKTGAITYAAINRCPSLRTFYLEGSGPDAKKNADIIKGMMQVAGRTGRMCR